MSLRTIDRPMQSLPDPFAERPIRRSLVLTTTCAAILFLPWQISEGAGIAMMMSVGWLALTGIIFGLPILAMSLGSAAIEAVRDHRHPPIDQLDLSPRVRHILYRHGYRRIRDVATVSDAELLGLANMTRNDVRQLRRSLHLESYASWQRAGFPPRARR